MRPACSSNATATCSPTFRTKSDMIGFSCSGLERLICLNYPVCQAHGKQRFSS